jgi:FkbM family methyltransferase
MMTAHPVVRVEEFQGIFEIDCRSHLLSRLVFNGHYEPQLVNVVLTHLPTDKDVIDVGANIGFYSVLIAQQLSGRKVLAVEPTDKAFRLLTNNVNMNHLADRVLFYKGVAANRSGSVSLTSVDGKEEYSTIGTLVHPSVLDSPVSSVQVPCAALDELASAYKVEPGFIKIDVEGAEHMVLMGATQIISQFRPIILAELSDLLLRQHGSSAKLLIEFLRDHRYDVVDPLYPRLPVGSRRFGDVLCVPR